MKLQYRTVDGEVGDRLDEFFKRKNTFVEVSPGAVIMPRKFAEIGQQILDASVRPTDVWLISYPRAGKELLTLTYEYIHYLSKVLLH